MPQHDADMEQDLATAQKNMQPPAAQDIKHSGYVSLSEDEDVAAMLDSPITKRGHIRISKESPATFGEVVCGGSKRDVEVEETSAIHHGGRRSVDPR